MLKPRISINVTPRIGKSRQKIIERKCGTPALEHSYHGFALAVFGAMFEKGHEMNRRLLILGVALLMVAGCARQYADGRGTDVGMRPVSYTLPLLGGGHDALDAHHGRVVLLDLWASWCPPCRRELPELAALSKIRRDIVVIAADQGEADQTVAEAARQFRLPFPVMLDRDQKYGEAYANVGLPTSVIISPDGKIAGVETGAHSAPEWSLILEKALSR